jgi:drug/metabolite transporter (DMT)-like permease
MRTEGVGYAIGAVAVWSTNALAAKFALTQLSAAQVLALQFFGAVATVLICRTLIKGRMKKFVFPGVRPLLVSIIGLVGTISLQYLAFASAPIIAANILAYGWPMFIAVWYGLSRWSARGLGFFAFSVVGFTGVSLIFVDGNALTYSGEYLVGYLYALGSAVCMAYFTVAVARFPKANTDAFLVAALCGTLITGVVAFTGENSWPSVPYLLTGIYIGIGPLAIGYYLWTRAMTHGEAARVAHIGYLTPLLSTGLLLATGETFTAHSLIGAVLVIGASIGVLVYQDEQQGSPRLSGRTA